MEAYLFIEIKLLNQNSIGTLKFPYKNAIWSSTPTNSVESAFFLMSLAALHIIFNVVKLLGENDILIIAIFCISWFSVSLDILSLLLIHLYFFFCDPNMYICPICLQNREGRVDT